MFETNKQGAVDIIRGDEPLCADAIDDVERLLEQCLADGPPRVVVEMRGMPLLDGSGLELLLDARERCESRGGTLKLAGPNPLCSDILSVTGVGRVFEIHDDIAAAVRSFMA